MEKKELIENLGPNFTMCFLDGCPRADKCVRHLAYEVLGGDKSYGSTVMPSSLKDGSQGDSHFDLTASPDNAEIDPE